MGIRLGDTLAASRLPRSIGSSYSKHNSRSLLPSNHGLDIEVEREYADQALSSLTNQANWADLNWVVVEFHRQTEAMS